MSVQTRVDEFFDLDDSALLPPAKNKEAKQQRVITLDSPRAIATDPYPIPNYPGLQRRVKSLACSLTEASPHLANRYWSMPKLLRDYKRCGQWVDGLAGRVENFAHDALFSHLCWENQANAARQGVENALLNVTKTLWSGMKVPLVPPRVNTEAELVANSRISQLQPLLTRSLAESRQRFVENFFSQLQSGVDNYMFGLVDDLTDDKQLERRGKSKAVRYCYYSRLVRDQFRRSKSLKDVVVALHVHDVVDAKLVPLPARRVRKPAWMKPLIAAIPQEFRSVFSMLTGAITLERVLVRDTQPVERANQYPMHCDPALVVAGRWVITGYGPLDLASKSKLREWTPGAIAYGADWHTTSRVVAHRRNVLGRPENPDLESSWTPGQ